MKDWPTTVMLIGAIGGLLLQLFSTLTALLIWKNSKELKRNSVSRKIKAGAPPKFGEFLLYFFLSKRDRINLLGDLAEEFQEVQKKFGRWPAKLLYYKQVACSIGPLIWRKLAKWGAITAVEEWVRRHI